MTAFYALEILKNRTAALSLNHKIGSRDIAKQEVKEIVMCIETHVIPTLEKALERAKKVEELLELYKQFGKQVDEFSEFSFSIYDEIKQLENEMTPLVDIKISLHNIISQIKSVDNNILPHSEKREIIDKLYEVENILTFNEEELEKELLDKDVEE